MATRRSNDRRKRRGKIDGISAGLHSKRQVFPILEGLPDRNEFSRLFIMAVPGSRLKTAGLLDVADVVPNPIHVVVFFNELLAHPIV
ncbi:hypothetical protein Ptr902_06194 [Pyrenophora tritici-repentis]|nr:hypothetical protein Alg130_03259 [Pyrenophora tritici-repentis]KAI0612486.1 hypothetical protein TUN205_03292 [Pyrenophora tritici-repentis]KAI2481813.1 hypothetical protein Ptr902_06194 [Pyrenophora tritici-repentis]